MKMKKITIVLVLLITNGFGQTLKIIDMRGMTEADATTHIVYRLNYEFSMNPASKFGAGVSYFNVSTKQDTLYWPGFIGIVTDGEYPGSFDFWENNPYKYINYFGDAFSSSLLIRHYLYGQSTRRTLFDLPTGDDRIIISKSSPDHVYLSSFGTTIVSTDSGKTWPTYTDSTGIPFPVIAISPFNKNKVFAYNDENQLLISSDGGTDFSITESSRIWNGNSSLYFDKDRVHVYAITNSTNGQSPRFLVSDDQGKPFTWTGRKIENDRGNWDYWNDKRYYHLVIDDSLYGKLYASYMNELYISDDFGSSFNLAYTLPSQVTGLYKSPVTETLYIANAYKIFSFVLSDSSLNVIKDITPQNLDTFYPLHTGDFWLYKTYSWFEGEYSESITRKEILGDTLLPNNKKYKIIKDGNQTHFQRFDSLEAVIFEYSGWDNIEFVLYNLAAVVGDKSNNGFYNYDFSGLRYLGDRDSIIFNQKLSTKQYHAEESLYSEYIHLSKKIGKVFENGYFDVGEYYIELQGAVINGVLYGDTTITAIKEDPVKPYKFALSQNYPNPFNPQTVINYELRITGHVKLTIYDIAGRKIETLISQPQSAGKHSVTFKADNLASGVYYYRIKAGSFIKTKKMVLLR
jgi:Secretion system C-terminal sorting domain/Sortilin, neurotensin receptor 3,